MAEARRICVGVIAGAHGVRGLVRVKSFTDEPENLTAYGPLTDESGQRQLALTVTGKAKGALLARIEGVSDRDRAQALHGARLYVERSALPEIEEEDEFYHDDLIGLEAEGPDGQALGKVVAVHNFGAGDVLEIQGPEGPSILLPFTREVVPEVDLAAGRLRALPPAEIVAKPEEA